MCNNESRDDTKSESLAGKMKQKVDGGRSKVHSGASSSVPIQNSKLDRMEIVDDRDKEGVKVQNSDDTMLLFEQKRRLVEKVIVESDIEVDKVQDTFDDGSKNLKETGSEF